MQRLGMVKTPNQGLGVVGTPTQSRHGTPIARRESVHCSPRTGILGGGMTDPGKDLRRAGYTVAPAEPFQGVVVVEPGHPTTLVQPNSCPLVSHVVPGPLDTCAIDVSPDPRFIMPALDFEMLPRPDHFAEGIHSSNGAQVGA